MSDLIDKLSRMTVKNGASLNEERIAREKIAKYAAAMNKPKAGGPSLGAFWKMTDEEKPIHEQKFLNEWYKLKMANRKKWKA